MARLLIRDEWYYRLSSTALLEGEYQRLIEANAERLFPEYHLVRFTRDLESDEGIRRPDFALIDKAYRIWWVVEVELAHHSLYGHVLPQVEVFSRATYDIAAATHLGANPSLDNKAVGEMLKGAPPRVCVIVNQLSPEWLGPISAFGALLTIVEVYRSDRNDHILRANGDYPEAPTAVVSACRVDPLVPRLVKVESPAALGVANGGLLSIEYEGGVTEWKRTDAQNKVWLLPKGGNPLPVSIRRFHLVRGESGRLMFVPALAAGGGQR